MTILSINQLTNEQKYLAVKRDFLLRDEKYMAYFKNMNPKDPDPVVDFEIDKISYIREGFIDLSDELGISYYESDGTFIKVTENFYDDYLYPRIKSMYGNYVTQIKNEFIKKDILNPTDIKFFGEKKMELLSTIISNLESAKHLNSSTKELIKDVFNEIINFVHINYIEYSCTEKINFNLKKNQVVVLFNILLDNKIISDEVLHFNEKLEKFFRYKNGEKFINISASYKTYKELLGKNPEKNANKVLESLKEKFSSPDFFNLK